MAPNLSIEAEFPDSGTATIDWNTSIIEGQRRVGWRFRCDPHLEPRLAVGLLREVAAELEMDLPD